MAKAKENFEMAETNGGTDSYILVADRPDNKKEIEIRNLTVRIPGDNGRELVKNVNMTLKSGDRVILTGASGTGKTTVAKAILNNWDYGDGLITRPSGIKIMSMSQQPHFPDADLRSILNLAPKGQHKYSDRELRKVLQAVGRETLVQHIPGQQVEILMDELLKKIERVMKPYKKHELTDDLTAEMLAKLEPQINNKVQELFNCVQYVPDAQKDYFREGLDKVFIETLEMSAQAETIDQAAAQIVHEIDIALVAPLKKHLSKRLLDTAEDISGKTLPYSPAKIIDLALALKKRLDKRIKAYMANEDTDDLDREIRINERQAHHLVNSVLGSFMLYGLILERNNPKSKSILSKAFNAASWPLSLLNLPLNAGKLASELTQTLTYFMEKQALTGNDFQTQQSGGQKQMLMIATVLLHKPDVLILDEITAALDKETARKLYKDMMDKLPADTIVLSIAHNDHIREFHTHHAHLADQTITVKEIDQAAENTAKNNCTNCLHKPKP